MSANPYLQLIFHCLVAVLLLFGPTLWLGEPLWRSERSTILIVATFAVAYLGCAILLLVRAARSGWPGIGFILVSGLAAFGVGFALLTLARWFRPASFGPELRPEVLFTSTAVGIAALVLLFRYRGAPVLKTALLVTIVAVAAVAQFMTTSIHSRPTRETSHVDTSLYALRITTFRNWLDAKSARGGGVAAWKDGYLLASGDGGIYTVRFETGKETPALRKLAVRVPLNTEDYERGARQALGDRWRGAASAYAIRMRVADIQVQTRENGRYRLFASHHHWKPREGCMVLRVSMIEGEQQDLEAVSSHTPWQTLYESTPCLTLNSTERGVVLATLQSGGSMGFLGEDELLLTVGDHQFDGWYRTPVLPQRLDNSYGKVILIQLDSGRAEIYSLGLRNPQGLHVDSLGRIWTTEHGPRGGDELNRVLPGRNYGWPIVTYGTEYSLHNWPFSQSQGRHEGFEKPMLAFVPSLALTGLTSIRRERFSHWRGDLLLTSLKGELRRVRVEDDRVTVAEPITINARLRDVVEGADGRLLLWTDASEMLLVEPADSTDSEQLVFQCTGCHTISEDGKSMIGPNLYRLMNRRVASARDFDYSPAMSRLGGRWTRERLDDFLRDPSRAVPGTTMEFAGIPDPELRAKLIDFFDSQ